MKSLKTSQFQVISGILESKSKNYQRYQKQDIFQLLRPNSSSVTKIKLNWCPICQNLQKIGHFQAIFLEVSRNNEILKFCVKNQVSWQKLSGIYTSDVIFPRLFDFPENREFPGIQSNFPGIPGNLLNTKVSIDL